MRDQAPYTQDHPRLCRRRVSTWWWLKRWSSLAFILRELSSIFVAWFVVFLLMLILAVSRGSLAYQEFLRWAANPYVLLLNVVGLLFVVFHAVTWFNLAPQAMVVHLKGKRVPGTLIAIANYAGWVVVSVAVAWMFQRV